MREANLDHFTLVKMSDNCSCLSDPRRGQNCWLAVTSRIVYLNNSGFKPLSSGMVSYIAKVDTEFKVHNFLI